jgi:hypothetical protein
MHTCKDDDCGIAKHSPGLLHVFKPTGEFLYEISVDASENTFLFPTYIAASSKADTIKDKNLEFLRSAQI